MSLVSNQKSKGRKEPLHSQEWAHLARACVLVGGLAAAPREDGDKLCNVDQDINKYTSRSPRSLAVLNCSGKESEIE